MWTELFVSHGEMEISELLFARHCTHKLNDYKI